MDITQWVKAAGIDRGSAPSVTIEPGAQVHRSPLGIREGASSALAMVGEALNDVWFSQTGRRQTIRLDTRHAEVGMASSWVLKIDGELATERYPMQLGPAEGAFRCADGQSVYLLCAFPSILSATLEVLGCTPDRESVARAIARRESAELEEALSARDLTGVIIRDHESWLRHPQGQVLENQPVVHLERLGDGPVVPIPHADKPLSWLRVLDATRVIAGPTITRTLGEFGADVLQVGSPDLPDFLPNQADTAHGKRRAAIDLNSPSDFARLVDVAAGADVFVQSFRADSLARRGLGPVDLARIRPGIIYVSESAYGPVGPWRAKRGFDGSVKAATGIQWAHREVEPLEGDEVSLAMAINDYCTGYWGAYGVLEAIRRRAVEGGSWHVQVSLAQTARWFMRMGAVHDANDGMAPAEAWRLVSEFSEQADSEYGRLTRLRPALRLSETPAGWTQPTMLPGNAECGWLSE